MNDETIRIIELGKKGYYCSQILLFLGLKAQGKSDPDLIKAMAGLAGGLGFSGDVCGALSGGACLLGLYAGRGLDEQEEDPRLNLMIAELVEWFSQQCTEQYGGIHCAQIIDHDPQAKVTKCPALVMGVWAQVKIILQDNGFDLSPRAP